MVNEIMNTIKARRSCRSFLPEPVKEEDLSLIIEGGLLAPSGANCQSCHFTILENREILEQINREIYKTYSMSDNPFLVQLTKNGYKDYFYGAPTVVVLSYDSQALTPELDTAVAAQNIMLAAESVGVASCWISFGGALSAPETRERFSGLLTLPENHVPHHAMALGYRQGEKRGPMKIKEGRVNRVI